MNPGELKPILTALVLPPAGPLLLVLLGLGLVAVRRRAAGLAVALGATAGLWLLACQAVAIGLAGWLLPPVAPMPKAQWPTVQAIVVLGGGVLREAPEYGEAQPAGPTLSRLRYGARLSRESGKPLAFAGGVGWASAQSDMAPEGAVATSTLRQDWGITPRWVDAQSRDTLENAREMRRLLAGIDRIALVTDAWHMPRSVLAFEAVGFQVVPAPTGFATATTRPLLQWLPSADGLMLSRQVMREWLALRVLH
jgi:uncharacterized SAM-binding protein YcdF (DUF218 family)